MTPKEKLQLIDKFNEKMEEAGAFQKESSRLNLRFAEDRFTWEMVSFEALRPGDIICHVNVHGNFKVHEKYVVLGMPEKTVAGLNIVSVDLVDTFDQQETPQKSE